MLLSKEECPVSSARERIRKAVQNVRRCGAEPFAVVALAHVPFILLLLSVLSSFLKGELAILLAPIGIAVFLAICLLAAMPMSVALSGYFIALAKGQHPRLSSIFCVFSDMLQYRHALNAMLCAALQALLYIAVCALPTLLCPMFPPSLRAIVTGLCLVGMVVMLFNRLLAYAFCGSFAWEYPYLTPREALRLSTHITQKRRWTLFKRLCPLVMLILLSAPTFGLLSLAVLPFFYALLADYYLEFKAYGGVSLPSPKEYAHV